MILTNGVAFGVPVFTLYKLCKIIKLLLRSFYFNESLFCIGTFISISGYPTHHAPR